MIVTMFTLYGLLLLF